MQIEPSLKMISVLTQDPQALITAPLAEIVPIQLVVEKTRVDGDQRGQGEGVFDNPPQQWSKPMEKKILVPLAEGFEMIEA